MIELAVVSEDVLCHMCGNDVIADRRMLVHVELALFQRWRRRHDVIVTRSLSELQVSAIIVNKL